MRIVMAHNYYRSAYPSGESKVFEDEIELLRTQDHRVDIFVRSSDVLSKKGRLGQAEGAFLNLWNQAAFNQLRNRLEGLAPDIVHVHNTFPLISPSIFYAVGKRAARVLTLHNYRLFCPAAIPMRKGKVCTECIDKRSSIPSMVHGCYRDSRVATLPLAVSVSLHRALGTWTKQVDAFICLSEFQKGVMIRAGLPAEKVHVKPNFYPGNPKVVAWSERKPRVVFVGRLGAEKGVRSLIRAWQLWGALAPELYIVGDGELRAELEGLTAGLPVRFLGQVTSEQAQVEIAKASLLVLPSECFEGFPMVIREAFAFGTPVAVSDIGPLPNIVTNGKNGVVFEPGSPQSLLEQVRASWETPGLLERLAQDARLEFESKYTEEANYTMLMNIYHQAIEVSRNG